MAAVTYEQRRGQLETYFDRTAVEAWARLTSDAPVSRIRATVRAGRDRMRQTLLDWLPADLSGKRILDAGCGTGALAVAAARRGAEVVAIDLSPKLVQLAAERLPRDLGSGQVQFEVGDMFSPALGQFDHVVAMDSLIHYPVADIVRLAAGFIARTRCSMVFTFAPRTPALSVMHAAGKLFPRSDRAPAIEPVSSGVLLSRLAEAKELNGWEPRRNERINAGFYISQALELARS